MKENIFDLIHTDDIPTEIIEDTRLNESNDLQHKILGVLAFADGAVTSTMMIIAVYRLYGVVVKKTVMNSTLSYMKNNRMVDRPRYAHYSLFKEVEGKDETQDT